MADFPDTFDPGQLRWGRMILRSTCSSCGQPLPLTILSETIHCPYCQATETIDRQLWWQLVGMLDALTDRHEHAEGTLGEGARQIVYQLDPAPPACEKCGASLADEAVDAGYARDLRCPGCGDPAGVAPAPDWILDRIAPARTVVSADPPPGSSIGDGAPTSTASPQLVAMACPRCGGGLEITETSGRLFQCNFCSVDVYLPDEIWRRLHPLKKMLPLFLGFKGKSAWRQEQEADAAKRDAERARQEKEKAAATAIRDAERKELAAKSVRSKSLAWRVVLVHLVLLLGSIATTWLTAASGGPGTGLMVLGGIIVVLSTLVTCAFVTRPIALATGYPGEWQLFATWFWVPFALVMPVVGSIMALVRGILLARGKFGSSTITSGSSSASYDAVVLEHGESLPAALFFLALALLWPVLLIAVLTPEDAARFLSRLPLP